MSYPTTSTVGTSTASTTSTNFSERNVKDVDYDSDEEDELHVGVDYDFVDKDESNRYDEREQSDFDTLRPCTFVEREHYDLDVETLYFYRERKC